LYSFVSLSPGLYVVTASQKGFEGVAQDNVLVTVDQVANVNIALRVGSVSETVTVTETTALVDTTNSTVGQLIESATIERVPLLTRNVFDLVQLSAGVTPANGAPNSSSSQYISSISSGRPGIDVSSYTINGAIIGSVYYMLDGSPLGRTPRPLIRAAVRASSAWSANPAATSSMAMPSWFCARMSWPPTTTLTS
jgi:hypothetical protein